MAEDDEVDVLGDYSFDLLNKNDSFDGTPLVSQNSDLLNCDYTIHPQWLLDKPSTNPALWYDTSDLDMSDYDAQAETTNIPQQNSINDESGWTEKEKDLLNRGIEIFGKSNLNLSQFIGSRTPAEVKYFLKNFYSDVQTQALVNVGEEILFDNCVETVEETVVSSNNFSILQSYEIPASIEEVIDSVSTAVTNVGQKPSQSKKKRSNSRKSSENISYDDVPCGQSLLKVNYHVKNKNLSKKNAKQKNPKVKFKTKLKYLSNKKNLTSNKNEVAKNLTSKNLESKNITLNTQPKKQIINNSKSNHKVGLTKENNFYSQTSKQTLNSNLNSDTINNDKSVKPKKDLQLVTGIGLGVSMSEGEQVVKIIKENDTESDSDVDIDIEDDDESPKVGEIKSKENLSSKSLNIDNTTSNNSKVIHPVKIDNTLNVDKTDSSLNLNIGYVNNIKNSATKTLPKRGPQLEDLKESVVKDLLSMEEPTCEVFVSRTEVCDVEKFLFFEFFESRPTKTPQRYLHIRNHILEAWSKTKPNYVRKTTIRNGLKQAGDVNLVGRIHSYLEQIAAINFGCEQVNYCRPLLDLAVVTVSTPKEKPVFIKNETVPRQRIKKKYINDGEGGYTLTHDEKGEIINTTVVNEEPAVKQKTYFKKPTIRLMYCRPFTEEYPQKYSINLDISTLILMDLHAHMHLTEVMGLIGGYWNPEARKLIIKRYIPCKNIASSVTHCDMCPISQAKAAEALHNENLDILGWYHSHPIFAPEPSQQDIETQLSVQQWIGNQVPCIGFILSPFSLHGALIASPYRCMVVNKVDIKHEKEGSGGNGQDEEFEEEQLVPYKFKVELLVERLRVGELLERARLILKEDGFNCKDIVVKSRVDFGKCYFQDNSITYLDKFIYSVKMHLAKCSGINKMTCDAIIDGLTRICKHYSITKN